jgi:hypothetical protein
MTLKIQDGALFCEPHKGDRVMTPQQEDRVANVLGAHGELFSAAAVRLCGGKLNEQESRQATRDFLEKVRKLRASIVQARLSPPRNPLRRTIEEPIEAPSTEELDLAVGGLKLGRGWTGIDVVVAVVSDSSPSEPAGTSVATSNLEAVERACKDHQFSAEFYVISRFLLLRKDFRYQGPEPSEYKALTYA